MAGTTYVHGGRTYTTSWSDVAEAIRVNGGRCYVEQTGGGCTALVVERVAGTVAVLTDEATTAEGAIIGDVCTGYYTRAGWNSEDGQEDPFADVTVPQYFDAIGEDGYPLGGVSLFDVLLSAGIRP